MYNLWMSLNLEPLPLFIFVLTLTYKKKKRKKRNAIRKTHPTTRRMFWCWKGGAVARELGADSALLGHMVSRHSFPAPRDCFTPCQLSGAGARFCYVTATVTLPLKGKTQCVLVYRREAGTSPAGPGQEGRTRGVSSPWNREKSLLCVRLPPTRALGEVLCSRRRGRSSLG